MRIFFIVIICFTTFLSCKRQEKEETKAEIIEVTSKKENIPTVDYSGLEPYLTKNDDKIYVVNFWATWCKPCVEELPYFEAITQRYKENNVEVLLVSLDFPNQKESRLIPFVNKKKLLSKVIHFDDENEQEWIPKINNNWTGAIPATIIYNKNRRKFYERSFTEKELESELQTFLN